MPGWNHPRQDSNLCLCLRRATLCPLSYGGLYPDANTVRLSIQALHLLKRSLLCLVLALCACQSLAPPDHGATQRARERRILSEATSIARAADTDRQRVMATVELQATEISALQRENAGLLVTVRAGDAPAQRVVAGTGQRPPLTPGSRWFAKTGISRFIDKVNDCVISPQISFTNDASILYVTWKAWNVAAGLRMSVQWWYEGQPVHSEDYPLTRAWSEACFWFSITPEMVPFTPGSWTVQIFANGASLESPQSFSMRKAEMMMDDG